MTTEEYSALLNRIDGDLAGWKAKVAAIDPGMGNASYEAGKQIETFKEVALFAFSMAQKSLTNLKIKRTISQELALADSLETVSWGFENPANLGVFNSAPHRGNK